MFSGLTNQVTSWMGAVKGENDEEVPQPPPGAGTEEPLDQSLANVEQAQAVQETVDPDDPNKANRFDFL